MQITSLRVVAQDHHLDIADRIEQVADDHPRVLSRITVSEHLAPRSPQLSLGFSCLTGSGVAVRSGRHFYSEGGDVVQGATVSRRPEPGYFKKVLAALQAVQRGCATGLAMNLRDATINS